MKYSRLVILPVLLMMLCYYGCSSKPTEQLERTEKAMQQAKAEFADQFATEDWSNAQKAYTEAQANVEKGKYGDANILLLKAKTRFEKARDLAKGKKEETIREIKGTQKTAQMRCEELRKAVADKKLTGAKKQEFEDICKEVEEKLARVTSQLDNGQFQDAKYLAGTTLRQVWEAQQDLGGGAPKAKKAS